MLDAILLLMVLTMNQRRTLDVSEISGEWDYLTPLVNRGDIEITLQWTADLSGGWVGNATHQGTERWVEVKVTPVGYERVQQVLRQAWLVTHRGERTAKVARVREELDIVQEAIAMGPVHTCLTAKELLAARRVVREQARIAQEAKDAYIAERVALKARERRWS